MGGDSGTASAPRISKNMAPSSFTKQTKDVPFFHGFKTEFPKFNRDFISLAKQHGLFRVFTEEVKIPVADVAVCKVDRVLSIVGWSGPLCYYHNADHICIGNQAAGFWLECGWVPNQEDDPNRFIDQCFETS